jgi:hypothetical protein
MRVDRICPHHRKRESQHHVSGCKTLRGCLHCGSAAKSQFRYDCLGVVIRNPFATEPNIKELHHLSHIWYAFWHEGCFLHFRWYKEI